jgi:hypothetical protein
VPKRRRKSGVPPPVRSVGMGRISTPGFSSEQPVSQADGWVARALLVQVATACLGVSIVASAETVELAARAAGSLAAVAAIAAAMGESARPGTYAPAGLTTLAVGVGVFPSPDAGAALYAGSLVVLVLAAPRLLVEAREALTLTVGNGPGITTDALGKREVSRARRANRPLTVACVSWAGRRRRFVGASHELRNVLRHTDVMGYAGAQRLFVFFVDTPMGDAFEAWRRIEALLQPATTAGMRVGFASFPQDNPTWQGLKELALEDEQRRSPSDAPQIPAPAPAVAEGA